MYTPFQTSVYVPSKDDFHEFWSTDVTSDKANETHESLVCISGLSAERECPTTTRNQVSLNDIDVFSQSSQICFESIPTHAERL
jgi:hypothetical protein